MAGCFTNRNLSFHLNLLLFIILNSISLYTFLWLHSRYKHWTLHHFTSGWIVYHEVGGWFYDDDDDDWDVIEVSWSKNELCHSVWCSLHLTLASIALLSVNILCSYFILALIRCYIFPGRDPASTFIFFMNSFVIIAFLWLCLFYEFYYLLWRYFRHCRYNKMVVPRVQNGRSYETTVSRG